MVNPPPCCHTDSDEFHSQETPGRRWSLYRGRSFSQSLAKLTVLQQIDLGEETGPRTVISGLVNYIPIEQMQDKWLVVVVSTALRDLPCLNIP